LDIKIKNNLKQLIKEEIFLSIDEINIKKALAEEYIAISDYKKFAMQSKNHKVKKVFLDIAKEEEIHVQEFELLLNSLGFDTDEFKKEAENEFKNL